MNIICKYTDENGEEKEEKIQPIKYNYNQAVDLGPTGFSVHYVGKYISSFTIEMNTQLEYYLITIK